MKDDLLEQQIAQRLSGLPQAMERAWPLEQARWWQAAEAETGGVRRPRHNLRFLAAGFVAGICAALSIASASVSPVAWSHTLASAFSRCGTDVAHGSFLSCPLEFFHNSAPPNTSHSVEVLALAPSSNVPTSAPLPSRSGSASSKTPTATLATPSASAVTSLPPAGQPTPIATAAPTPTASSGCTSSPMSGNLIANWSFESGLSGWQTYNSSLAWVNMCGSAPDGKYVEEATYTPGTSSGSDSFSANDANAFTSTVAGQSYRATAWVKAATPSAIGKYLELVIREQCGTTHTNINSAGGHVFLNSTFQQVTVTNYTAVNSGCRLNVYAAGQAGGGQPGPVAGDAFYIDKVGLFTN